MSGRGLRGVAALGALALLAVSGALAALPSAPAYKAPQAGVGLNPWNSAVADFDRDGDADVAVANAGGDDVSVLRNAGGGVLAEPVDYATGNEPRGIAAGDLDGDDDADLVVSHFSSPDLVVLEGNGDGTFTRGASYPVGTESDHALIHDLDADGAPDVVVAGHRPDAVSVLMNDGTGALVDDGVLLGHSFGATAVAAGDLNGDGHVDLAASSSNAFEAHVLLGAGDGTFTLGEVVTTSGTPRSIALGDVDGDGDLDLATADFERGSVTIGRNDGDAHFAPVTQERTDSMPMSIAAGDLNGDGRAELVVANSGHDSISVITSALRGGGFEVHTKVGPRSPWGVTLARVDGDAVLDAVLVSGTSCRPRGCFIPGKATVLLNAGGIDLGGYDVYETGRREPVSDGCIFGFDPDRKRVVSAGDLNGDGGPDLAVGNCEDGDFTLLLNNGFGFTEGGFFPSGDGNPAAVAGGDVDGDADRDLVVVYDASLVQIHPNNGAAVFSATPIVINQAVRRPFVAVEDMTNDGEPDIVIGAQQVGGGTTPANIAVHVNDGRGGFATVHRLQIASGIDLRVFALGDLDGDGDKDVVTAADMTGAVTALINDGAGRLTARTPVVLTDAEPVAIAAGDIDNDLDVDVAVAEPAGNAIHLLRNDGAATLAPAGTLPAGDEVAGVALADVDGDGRLDLVYTQDVAADHPNENAVVRLNEGGTFGDPVGYLAGTNARSILVAQLNGAGGPELVVTDDSKGHVWVLENGRGGLFADADVDAVPDILEPALGLVPLDPDSDDDGIGDGIDPDVLRAMLERLPKEVFGAPGRQAALLAKLKPLEALLLSGKRIDALKHLAAYAARVDGCAFQKVPDADDWVTSCDAQQKLRLPYALITSNLKGVPLPKEFLPPPKPQEPPGN